LRAFLDTNVLVSAFTTRGLCSDVLRTVLTEHELILGAAVIGELRRVLKRVGLPKRQIEEIVAFLSSYVTTTKLKKPARLPTVRDPDDARILAEAVGANADVLITGDKDLLLVAGESPISILSPRGFWELAVNGDQEARDSGAQRG
jgi:putative PIN family toxin of toxin-antitoxin system